MMKLEKENTEDIYALSSIQENLLFHYVSNPGSDSYVEQIYFELEGDIQVQTIYSACVNVIKNNAVLRTVFRWENIDSPIQIVLKKINTPFSYCEKYYSKNMDKSIINIIMENDRKNVFMLQHIPYRFCLYKLSEQNYLFGFVFHHILLDGWSSSTLCQQIFKVYTGLLKKQNIENVYRPSYKQYVKVNRSVYEKENNREYWKKYLDDVDTITNLFGTDKNVSSDVGTGYFDLYFDNVQSTKIFEFCKSREITFASFIYGAWAILLQRYTNVEDVIFGITVSDRPSMIKDVDKIIGLLINTIPMRVKGKEDNSILELLYQIQKNIVDMLPHQGVSYTKIKQSTKLSGNEPLFNTLVVIDNYPIDKNIKIHEFSITNIYTAEGTDYPVTVQVLLYNQNIRIRLMYNKAIVKHSIIKHVAEHLQIIIDKMLNHSELGIFSFNILTEQEKNLLFSFNETFYDYPYEMTIPQLFEEICCKVPNKISVMYGTDNISYKELKKKVNKLAKYLLHIGIKEGENIAIAIPPSIDMVVAIIAILKLGCVCVPLDITYPDIRNQYILRDSEVSGILEISPSITVCERIKRICINNIPDDIDEKLEIISSEANAFLLYTSGSTGNPKGVYLNHKGIINHIWIKRDILEISTEDRVACTFSINVVASIWQLLLPLLTGASLYLYPTELEKDPYALFQQLEKDKICVVELIPSQLEVFIESLQIGKPYIDLSALKRIALTSEAVMPQIVNQFYQYYNIMLVNCYGQTECCDDTVHYPIPVQKNITTIPIGKPSYNTRIYILDKHSNIQPIGVMGELCVAGDGVTTGYKGKTELTREKFKFNHFEKKGLLYHTGDLAKWTEEGLLICYGRIDRQVKIRGNRIELGEIEECVKLYEGILAVCTTVKKINNQTVLAAYYVSNQVVDEKELKEFLIHRLPRNSIPSIFKKVDILPKTPNGKVDIRALPDVSFDNAIKNINPQNEIEDVLYHIWCEILNLDTVSLDENFFDVGGHSLLLIKVQNQIKKELDIDISVIELLEYTTIHSLASYISSGGKRNTKLTKDKPFPQKKEKDSVAIIGLAGRFPQADNVHEFWDNIVSGKNCITTFSIEEIESDKNKYSPLYVPSHGILNDVEMFDAAFFDISPREAELMDPQQRKFLECAWEALEDAGYAGKKEERVGVYVSSGFSTYLMNQIIPAKSQISESEFQVMIGNDKDFLATKTSYKLDLTGPALTVQSACSSSLSAIYLAYQELLNDKCDIALSGGAYISIPQNKGYIYELNGNLSSDGLCKTFDSSANGSVMGNGVGVIILKRLSDALKDEDHIYAIIEAAGVNNDGNCKASYTAPNVSAQAELILQTQKEAAITPKDIDYIETHGTGTELGDSIELTALHRVFSAGEYIEYNSCALGSLKTIIGHLDVAAGVAGLIKTVLMLKNKVLPPSLNFELPNDNFDFISSPFYVNTRLRAWETDKIRRAGISCFGIGGTNVHMILKEAPSAKRTFFNSGELIIISAKTIRALGRIAGNLSEFILTHKEKSLRDIAYTLQTGRKTFEYRKAFYAKDIQEAVDKLNNISGESQQIKHNIKGKDISFEVYEWDDVCKVSDEMYYSNEYYRAILDTCCAYLYKFCDIDLKPFLFRKNSNKYKIMCQFVIQYAVLKSLEKMNIQWKEIDGFGIGKYVADCIKNLVTLEEALQILVQETTISEYNSENKKRNGFCIKYNVVENADMNSTELLSDESSLSDEWLMWSIVGILWEKQLVIDYRMLFSNRKGRKISLPTYPFERKKYWIEAVTDESQEMEISENSNTVSTEMYLPIWKQSLKQAFLAENILTVQNDKKYVIFSNCKRFSGELLKQFATENKQVIFVYAGNEYINNCHECYYIRPNKEEDYIRLFADIGHNNNTIAAILHFWLIREKEGRTENLSNFQQNKILGFYSSLYIVKALKNNPCYEKSVNMYMFNIGTAQINKKDKLYPENYLINGLYKIIKQEYPQIICQMIDLAASFQEFLIEQSNLIKVIMNELKLQSQDDYVAYRNGIRWLPDYEVVNFSDLPKKEDNIVNNGVYVITGGLGRIGQAFAKILARKATNINIIILSRRKLSITENNDDIDHFFSELKKLGAHVELISCDISSHVQVKEAFDYIYDKYESLDGVIHLAGITGKTAVSFIAEEEMNKCETQFGPKVYGIYNMLSALKKDKPKFMILLSSLCTILGGIGSATYASANSVLDAMALSEEATFPICTINWEAWYDENIKNWYTLNKYAMSEKEACQIFEQILDHVLVPRLILSKGSIKKRKKELNLSEKGINNSINKTRIKKDNVNYIPPTNAAEQLVCEIWEEYLGILPIGIEDNFFDCGGHSLIAARITTQIYNIFEVQIPIKDFFVNPTIQNLVSIISELRGGLEITIQVAQLYKEIVDMPDDNNINSR